MQETQEIPGTDPRMATNAISVYNQESDALDDFPVLKAFQQYIDSEQAKARKRMVSLCIFFGVLMFVVISFFVAMLMYTSNKKNELYDRLIECAMQDRARAGSGSAVVVQPPSDNSAIMALTAKMDELQKKLASDQEKAAKAAAEAAAKAEKAARDAALPKPPSAAELENQRLKALLAAEKEKNAEERKKQHEAEIEAYRRRYYPEVYARRTAVKPTKKKPKIDVDEEIEEDTTDDLLEEIKDLKPVSYYGEDEEDEEATPKKSAPKTKKPRVAPVKTESLAQPEPPKEDQKEYSIPVDVKGSSSSWIVPEED